MEENINNMPMLGEHAPRFVANSTFGPLKLTDYLGKWLILFSYPSNFTPVSTTEIISLSKYNNEFKKRNCELLGLSIDNIPSHMAWIKDIEQSANLNVSFPIISDTDKTISNMYGMSPNTSEDVQTVRNVFFIDPNQVIRCIFIYPISNGRNISEFLRMIDALQIADKEGVDTPANWVAGNSTIVPSPRSYTDFIDNIKINNTKNCMDWYLRFNKDNNDLRRW